MKIRMSALAVVLLAGLWSARPAAAQDQVGVLVGLNSATLATDGDVFDFNTNRLNGFVGGVSWTRQLQGVFGIEVDALIAQKGAQIDFGADDEFKVTLTYLDIPVLARYSRAATPAVGFHVYAGPSFNFKIAESSEENGEEVEEEDVVDSFETAVVFGGGLSFGRVRVDARYGLGLTSLADAEEIGFAETAKNQVFSVLFGIALR